MIRIEKTIKFNAYRTARQKDFRIYKRDMVLIYLYEILIYNEIDFSMGVLPEFDVY